MVCSTHSARLQAAVAADARRGTRWRSRASGRRAGAASATSVRCRSVGDGSGCSATVRRATSLASVQFTEPSCGAIIACIWLISAERSGIPAPPAAGAAAAQGAPEGVEDLLERRALERVGLLVVRTVAGLVRHGSKLLAASNRAAARLGSLGP